jgi:hypothetical protein
MVARPIVANLTDAIAALDAAPDVTGPELWSPREAASIQGVLWFLALQQALDRDYPDRPATVVLDCGDRADCAIEALRGGLRAVVVAAPETVAAKVADIAAQLGGRVYRRN